MMNDVFERNAIKEPPRYCQNNNNNNKINK